MRFTNWRESEEKDYYFRLKVLIKGVPTEGYLTKEYFKDAIVSESGLQRKLIMPQRTYGKQYFYETYNVLKYLNDEKIVHLKSFSNQDKEFE